MLYIATNLNDLFFEMAQSSKDGQVPLSEVDSAHGNLALHCEQLARIDHRLGLKMLKAFESRPDLDTANIAYLIRGVLGLIAADSREGDAE